MCSSDLKQQSAKALNYLGPNGGAMVNYDLSAISFGLNVGVNYNNTQWKLGFSLRSGLSYNAKGDATVSNAPGFFIDNGTLPGSAVNATSKIKLPAVISMGAAYQLDQDWTITADLNIYNWGKIDSILVETENYNSCNLNIRQDLAGSYAMRMGASYNFSKKIIFRGGMAFDLSPVLDTYVHPAFPTYNKFTYTAGGSYKLKNNFSADAFVGYSAIKERKEVKNINNFNGTYKSNMFIGGIGLNYEF